ncbi:hypothetical protein ACFOEY_19550 [Paracandidimonas soli]|uniref:hypothetical protein n=1 Tax=Paracandidimonas soli TaxID=1917182 RepID=UPI003607806B
MSGLDARMELEGFNNIPRRLFKRGPLRRAFRRSGQVVAKEARKRISARGPGVGEYPLKRSGRLQKSIKVRVSKAGLLVRCSTKSART